eukprot:gene23639-26754_t
MKLDESTSTAEADKLVYTYPQLVDEVGGSNIVTLPYSFHVAANETAEKRPRPRWVFSDKGNPTMLTTRYQKRACMLNIHPVPCGESPADVLQYGLYELD